MILFIHFSLNQGTKIGDPDSAIKKKYIIELEEWPENSVSSILRKRSLNRTLAIKNATTIFNRISHGAKVSKEQSTWNWLYHGYRLPHFDVSILICLGAYRQTYIQTLFM